MPNGLPDPARAVKADIGVLRPQPQEGMLPRNMTKQRL
jgi:hypothetical protein